MSQVIVTKDNITPRRVTSATQEHKIDREGQFKRWRRNDITGFDPIAAAAGIAMLPVLAIWWVFSWAAEIAVFVAIGVSRLVSTIVGPMKE